MSWCSWNPFPTLFSQNGKPLTAIDKCLDRTTLGMTVWPHKTMAHRGLAPLSQEGMVCWVFLTTTGTVGGCAGQWERQRQSPNSVAEPAFLGCVATSTRIDRLTAFEIVRSAVLCTAKRTQCFLSTAYAQGQCLLEMLIQHALPDSTLSSWAGWLQTPHNWDPCVSKEPRCRWTKRWGSGFQGEADRDLS